MNRLKDDSEGLDKRACYKRVFSGNANLLDCQQVLDDLLYTSGWTQELKDVRFDMGVYLAQVLGFYDPQNRETMTAMIIGLDSASYPLEKKRKVIDLGRVALEEESEGVQP